MRTTSLAGSALPTELDKPSLEYSYLAHSMVRQVLPDLVDGLLMAQQTGPFGKKKVGKTDDFFFHRNGGHVPSRHLQILPDDVVHCKANSDMSFTHHSM